MVQVQYEYACEYGELQNGPSGMVGPSPGGRAFAAAVCSPAAAAGGLAGTRVRHRKPVRVHARVLATRACEHGHHHIRVPSTYE